PLPVVFRSLPLPVVFRSLPLPVVFRLLPLPVVFRLLPLPVVFRSLPLAVLFQVATAPGSDDCAGRASALLHYSESIWSHGRGEIRDSRTAAHPAEDEQVEEMHPAQNEKHQADLPGQRLDALAGRFDLISQPERQANITQIDEVEADDQQMVDRIS